MKDDRRHKVPSKSEREAQAQAKVTRKAARKPARRRAASKGTVCGHDRSDGCAAKPFMGLIRWTDPTREPDMFAMRVCCTGDGEMAHICMKIPTREIASIELRPARRPMTDHAGHAEDAVRLANAGPQ